jgi:hypothetical protein
MYIKYAYLYKYYFKFQNLIFKNQKIKLGTWLEIRKERLSIDTGRNVLKKTNLLKNL